jgi:hypothetical protein
MILPKLLTTMLSLYPERANVIVVPAEVPNPRGSIVRVGAGLPAAVTL